MRPQRYRKKPSTQCTLGAATAYRLWLISVPEVEAVQLTPENLQEAAAWCGADYTTDPAAPYPGLFFEECKAYCIKTTKASLGDYIIKGEGPEFYISKPDLFERVFELILKWRIEKTLGGWAVYEPLGEIDGGLVAGVCSGAFEKWEDARDWATDITVRAQYWMDLDAQ